MFLLRSFARQTARRTFVTATQPSLAVIPFNLADIGEGIAEVEIMSWMINEGDVIDEFDEICEVQSDKATVTITSRYAGKITQVHYEAGDLAAVGKPLISIDVEGEVAEETAASGSSSEPTPTPRQPDPTTVTVPEPAPEVPLPKASSVATGEEHVVAPSPSQSSARASSSSGGSVLATPAVRRLAGEHNVSLSQISATGKGGRVTKTDLLTHIGAVSKARSAAAAAAATTSSSSPSPSSPSGITAPAAVGEIPPKRAYIISPNGLEQRDEPIRGISRMMVQSMKESLKIPHFGYYDEIEMDALIELRTDLLPSFAKRDVKLSYMPIMLKAASMALADFPSLNSSVSNDEETQTYRGGHNIGVAMDTPRGLLVPNVANCESRSVFEIAYEMNRLQAMGAQNKLGADELTGGTFTLSNIGVIGGTYASPVILPGQVSIGALGKLQKLPRYNEAGDVVPKTLMQVSWSADHRVIDGATMARFSNQWKVCFFLFVYVYFCFFFLDSTLIIVFSFFLFLLSLSLSLYICRVTWKIQQP